MNIPVISLMLPPNKNPRKVKGSMKVNYLTPYVLTTAFACMIAGCQKNETSSESQEISELDAGYTLAFGLYTADKPSEVVAQFRPVLDELEDSLSANLEEPVSIKLDISSSYEKGIEQLAQGNVDFARLGPASYILAKNKNENLKLLAMESNKGKKTFSGVIAIHRDSNLATLEDLAGKDFAFGDKRSTIGRYLSQRLLQQAGVRAKDLKSYDYLGRHDAVAAAVGTKKFHAGALKESTFKKMKAKGTPIKALITFPNITKPWVASDKLPTEVALALKKSLLEMTSPQALQALGKQGFLDGSFDDYNYIQLAMDSNSAFFE